MQSFFGGPLPPYLSFRMLSRIVKKLKQTSRIEEYAAVLQAAIDNHYAVVSLRDWYQHYRNSDSKVFILRHDVDYDTEGAYAFFRVERQLGVRSTSYFRWSSMDDTIMREMNDNGFEVSLHFETLASYAKQHRIFDKEAIDERVIAVCQQNLSEEIELFEKKYWKIDTICSHGDKRNRVLGLPNHIIWDDVLKKKHRILCETYEESVTKCFDAYISDSSVYSSFEWQHFGSPIQALEEGRRTICLLTHPIHWNQSFLKNIKMMSKAYVDNL